ncbi:MAG: DUF2948 family protein [Hyphomicrobiaceae bacterium]
MADNPPLKLLALDDEDLAILSAHLQDAVMRVGDMTYLPGAKRFAAVLNRFDWLGTLASGGDQMLARRRAGLRFERVLSARRMGIDLARRNDVLSLLSVTATHAGQDDPGGRIRLDFSGGTAVELVVECIEVELRDLGAQWQTGRQPTHDPDPSAQGGAA